MDKGKLLDKFHYDDHVQKRPKINRAYGIGGMSYKFHSENIEYDYEEVYVDAGISTHSCNVGEDNDMIDDCNNKINSGKPRQRRRYRRYRYDEIADKFIERIINGGDNE